VHTSEPCGAVPGYDLSFTAIAPKGNNLFTAQVIFFGESTPVCFYWSVASGVFVIEFNGQCPAPDAKATCPAGTNAQRWTATMTEAGAALLYLLFFFLLLFVPATDFSFHVCETHTLARQAHL
jgi:hypothetical protein